MKKYFLSSMLVMGLMSPVFAADGIITGGAGTCTVDVLGVFENDATANTIATWTLNEYECGAGQYLLNSDGTLECTECPVGSYCPGGKFTVESENNGTNACPTDYTSDAGAVGENECYMGCELACSTNAECPPHSNNCTHSEFKTTGKQFSGSVCNAYPSVCPIADFGCDTGYTKTTIPAMDIFYKYASFVEEHNGDDTFNVSLLLFCTLEGKDYTSPNYDGDHSDRLINSISDCDFLTPGQMLLVSADMSFSFMVDISKNEYNGADIPGAIKLGEEEYSSPDYLLYNADFKPGVTGQGDKYWVRYSNIFLPTPDTEIIYRYISGELELPSDAADQEKLLAWLSTMFSSDLIKKIQQNPDLIADESGVALLFASLRDIELPNTWISMNNDWFAADAHLQFAIISWSLPLWGVIEAEAFEDNPEQGLEAVFGGASYCNNNTININWNPDNGGEHIQNMCYYDGAVTLPSDPVKPGYTFTGWKLVE